MQLTWKSDFDYPCATQGNKHTHMHALSFLTLLVPFSNNSSPVGGYSTLATQPYFCKACYSVPDEEHLRSCLKRLMSMLGPTNRRRSMVDAVWPYQTQSTAKRESKLTSTLTAACESARKVHQDHLIRYTGESERWYKLPLNQLR